MRRCPDLPAAGENDQVLFWDRTGSEPPRWITVDRPKQEHQTAHAQICRRASSAKTRASISAGPTGALNLRAHNLMIFLQMADGVDDATWLHHLHRGDYSRWFRDAIKDDDLADEAESVQDGADAAATRTQIREIVERRYTAPAQTSQVQ